MIPEVTRKAEGRARKDARSEEIALALMGIGPLRAEELAADAIWERGDGAPLSGASAIQAALAQQVRPDCVSVEQVVTHGKAASISGRLQRGSQAKIFCHVIRHTSDAATQVAQIVSFEHEIARKTALPPTRKGARNGA
jgi:hypothetical protein